MIIRNVLILGLKKYLFKLTYTSSIHINIAENKEK